ncbi:nitroreductase/quinone reductase family protein [Kitasatospora purpeofusca]|uniref:nitroreductase/quinone reductase family protein n=1 Tax=Kitasatospora purpeofusca TaxID=67352 RepID=UPI0036D25902
MSWNERIIKEFRENNGKVGGMFEGAPMVVLTTAGRRTGKPHTNPAIYLRDGGRYLVFASNLGNPEHPDWFHNLVASPQVTLEIGTDEGRVKPFATRAVVLEGEERDRLYELQSTISPAFREYQEKTTRVIPVVALHPLDLSTDNERNKMIGRQLIIHHNELRTELAELRAAVEAALDGGGADRPAADLTRQLHRRCLTFCYGLQMHHTREDGSFTAFEQQFPHLAPAITRLREEHKVVEQALARLEEVLERALAAEGGDVAELRAELDRAINGLEEHFAYEEEHLLPALDVPRPS